MSGDEFTVLIASLGISGWYWFRWLMHLLGIAAIPGAGLLRLPLFLVPSGAVLGLLYLLLHWAAHDVRGDQDYIFFYLMMGSAWMALGSILMSFLGINMREDVCERGNAAAAWAVCGGLVGIMAAFAGANIGDGPGWWCVAFAGGLATIALAFGWVVLDRSGGINHSVTVERDTASGIRLGAYLLASGIIAGRGAAGNWTSAGQTVIEFSSAWPIVPLTLAAMAGEWACRPRPARPSGSVLLHGLLPAALYLQAAYATLLNSGPLP